MALLLPVKVHGRGLGSVCDTKAPLQLQLRLVAQYECYIPSSLLYYNRVLGTA